MSPITVLLPLVACVAGGYLTYLVLAGRDETRTRALANLGHGAAAPARRASGAVPRRLSSRNGTGAQWVPKGELRLLDRLLAEAGRPASWPLDRVVAVKLWSTVAAIVLMALFVIANPSARSFVLGLLFVALVYAAPELRLYSLGMERREKMTTELADVLDQMSIAVEAGLGFEGALLRVSNNSTGVLAGELRRTLQVMQVGQPRREAYLALSTRARVPELRRFIRAVVQAEESGLALTDVLRTQAAEMRLIRRQRAEQRAMKIPVKVIFPLTLCILPVLFIVVLGPAAINIIDTFN